MNKETVRKELYEKVNEWFAEQPQRPIAQFMFETMWQYIEAAQHSVQADLPCACRITRGYVRRINPACQIHGDKAASR